MSASEDGNGEGKESVVSHRGLHITYYQLVSHAVPGIICLLMVLPFLGDLLPPVETAQWKPWQQLITLAIGLLLFALPVGFLLSGVSFFIFGFVVFGMKYLFLRFSWLPPWPKLSLDASLGRPAILDELRGEPRTRKFPGAMDWARFTGDVEFILRAQRYGGPRVDAPEWILAVAILSRTLALLTILSLPLWLANDQHWLFGSLLASLLLFTAVAELYRDYELAFSAEHFIQYRELVDEGEKIAAMLSTAKNRLLNSRRIVARPRFLESLWLSRGSGTARRQP